MYGGVLSLFVKFSRAKIIKFVVNHSHNIWEKNPGKYGRLKNCTKKKVEKLEKRLSDKNNKSVSP